MKKRFSLLFLCCAIVVSGLALAAYGAHLKYQVLGPHDLGQEYNIIELPFILETDDELRYMLEAAQNPYIPEEPFTEPTLPTTQPVTEPPTVPTTVPPTTAPTEPATEPSTEPSAQPPTEPSTEPSTEPDGTVPPETQPEQVISLNREGITFSEEGTVWKLYDGTVDKSLVSFSSSNEKVVTFVDGVLTAVGEGSAYVYAEYNGQRLSCYIVCKFTQETVPPETQPPTTEPPATQPPVTEPPTTEPPATEPPATEPPATEPEPTAPTSRPDTYPGYSFAGGVSSSWFNNTLFIGDSRTVGLQYWGRSGNADYFCDVGLTVYSAMSSKKKLSDNNFSNMNLSQLLSSRTYDKIFISLGINECGSGTAIMGAYSDLVATIRQMQPNAKIILQAIMHTTEGYLANGKHFGPDNLDRINNRIKGLADGATIFYIDVNPYFTDSRGYLYKELSGDGCHLYAKNYTLWSKWISYAVAQLGI